MGIYFLYHLDFPDVNGKSKKQYVSDSK